VDPFCCRCCIDFDEIIVLYFLCKHLMSAVHVRICS
jgi:hypothetical protein